MQESDEAYHATPPPAGARAVPGSDAATVGTRRLRLIGAIAGGTVVAGAIEMIVPRLAVTLTLTGVAGLLALQSSRVRSWVGVAAFGERRTDTGSSKEQARLEGIIRSAMEAIITVDESQKILIFNPMAEKLFACTAKDAIGTSVERFVPSRFRRFHGDKIKQFGITGVTERHFGRQRALFGVRANGDEFPIEASISQLVEGNARLYTIMLRDVTDRVKAEAELQASRNELRQLSASIQTAREEEKARIARELHDDLGQRLTALKMDLSLLAGELEERGDFANQVAQTHAMQRLIDDTVGAVREIASDLRPVMLDDLGLVAAIEWLSNEWRSRYGIVVTLDSGPLAWHFNREASNAIFRIVQEALTNIARHANATRASVTLTRTAASAVVCIADNGVGVEQARAAGGLLESTGRVPGASFGLIGMRERVRLLGGEVTLESPSDGGFIVTATIPLEGNELPPPADEDANEAAEASVDRTSAAQEGETAASPVHAQTGAQAGAPT